MTTFKPQRILAGVDLGPTSERVLGWAGLLACRYKAEIRIIYSDWWEPPIYFTHGQIEELRHGAQEHVRTVESKLAELGKKVLGDQLPFTPAVERGYAPLVILQEARKAGSDLIVLGSHGRTGLARLRLGSVAEDIAREAVVPTLIVRSNSNNGASPGIQRILCPVDFEDHSRETVGISAEIAAAFSAHLSVIHAVHGPETDTDAALRRLCDWTSHAVRIDCRLEEHIVKGKSAEQIVHLARSNRANLVVLSAQHHPFLEFTTLGTTTERVLRHSPSPVLVIPRVA